MPSTELFDKSATQLALLLTDARRLGFLGPGPISDQVARSLAFGAVSRSGAVSEVEAGAGSGAATGSGAAAVSEAGAASEAGTISEPGGLRASGGVSASGGAPVAAPGELAVDLGTGGGLPGLVLALLWPHSRWLFVESNQRKSAWLQDALIFLAIEERVLVICDRAERVGRSRWRQQASTVTARGFGPPGPTAECAAPLLRRGGQLLVADPPGAPPERWPAAGLVKLGLQLDGSEVVTTVAGPVSLSRLVAVSDCGEQYPRRVGVPFKRPLF
jgi:16S rRNA (guanine527-N7)-methyltransferase